MALSVTSSVNVLMFWKEKKLWWPSGLPCGLSRVAVHSNPEHTLWIWTDSELLRVLVKEYIVGKPTQTCETTRWFVWSSQTALSPCGNYKPSPLFSRGDMMMITRRCTYCKGLNDLSPRARDSAGGRRHKWIVRFYVKQCGKITKWHLEEISDDFIKSCD